MVKVRFGMAEMQVDGLVQCRVTPRLRMRRLCFGEEEMVTGVV